MFAHLIYFCIITDVTCANIKTKNVTEMCQRYNKLKGKDTV